MTTDQLGLIGHPLVQNAGSIIVCLSADYLVIEWSRGAEQALGWPREAIIGKNYLETCIDHPYQQAAAANIQRVLAGAETLGFENPVKTQTGEERIILWNASPLPHTEAHTHIVIAIGFDITDQRRTEATLRASESSYRMLNEQASEAIIVTNDQGIILEANTRACEIFGYTREEMNDIRVPDLVAEDIPPPAENLYELKRGQRLVSERRLRRKDGSIFPAELSSAIVDDGRYHVIVRDISERRRLEAQQIELVVERERVSMLQGFIRDASHDLYTPLSVLQTSLYLLRKTMDDPERRENHLSELEYQVGHLHELVQDLLVMSRLDAADVESFNFEPHDLNALVNDIVQEQDPFARDAGQQLTFEPAADLPPVLLDSTEFQRVVRHLIVNAHNYTPEGGTINIRTFADHDNVFIYVKDTGIGIEADDIPYIFDHFYRADAARSIEKGGMGLGLTIARRITDAHNGEISVESVPDAGSTFRVRLPIG